MNKKSICVLSIMLIALSSCATFRTEEEGVRAADKNAGKVFEAIKNDDVKLALDLFTEATGMYYHNRPSSFTFFDKQGKKRTFSADTGTQPEPWKFVVLMLNGLYKCSKKNVDEIEECLDKFHMNSTRFVNGGRLYEYEIKEDDSRCRSKQGKEKETCSVLTGLIYNMCGKPYPHFVRHNYDNEAGGPWGGVVPLYAFNSSYTDHWKELATIRKSKFCKGNL